MPIFLAALLGGLLQAAASMAGRVLISLGVGFVTYSGVNATISYIVNIIHTTVQGTPALLLAALGLVQFDVVVSMLVAAVTAKFVINGLTSGALKKMVYK